MNSLLTVKILGVAKNQSKGSYTMYELEVSGSILEAYVLYKRYSEFLTLHNNVLKLLKTDDKLKQLQANDELIIPEFPKKQMNKNSSKVVEDRQEKLQFYLRTLLKSECLCQTDLVMDFLAIPKAWKHLIAPSDEEKRKIKQQNERQEQLAKERRLKQQEEEEIKLAMALSASMAEDANKRREKREQQQREQQQQQQQQQAESQSPLPAGWSAYRTADGKMFYHNESSKLSQWDRPVEVKPVPADPYAAAPHHGYMQMQPSAPSPASSVASQQQQQYAYQYQQPQQQQQQQPQPQARQAQPQPIAQPQQLAYQQPPPQQQQRQQQQQPYAQPQSSYYGAPPQAAQQQQQPYPSSQMPPKQQQQQQQPLYSQQQQQAQPYYAPPSAKSQPYYAPPSAKSQQQQRPMASAYQPSYQSYTAQPSQARAQPSPFQQLSRDTTPNEYKGADINNMDQLVNFVNFGTTENPNQKKQQQAAPQSNDPDDELWRMLQSTLK